mgnify:CR=1 FL=1
MTRRPNGAPGFGASVLGACGLGSSLAVGTVSNGFCGLAGCACLGTLFFVTGSPINRQRRSAALELAQTLLQTHALRARAGVTSPNERVLVVRALAPLVEPVGELLRQLWAGWRQVLWQLGCDQPRIWAT